MGSESALWDKLAQMIVQLRDPVTGCAWHRAQSAESISYFTIEEAYEIQEAICDKNYAAVQKELGDIFFHVLYYMQFADENGWFSASSVIQSAIEKIESRHPHVFLNPSPLALVDIAAHFESQKANERAKESDETGCLAGISTHLPPLTMAMKLQHRAALVGLDFSNLSGVLDKLHEESAELEAVLDDPQQREAQIDELGDVFFTLVNMARHMNINPDEALRRANQKFKHRVEQCEALARSEGNELKELSAAQLDACWNAIKTASKKLKQDNAHGQ